VKIPQRIEIIVNNQAQKARKTSRTRGKSTKTKDTHRIAERYEILDGAVDIIRTTKSGQFWSMSCWLKNEGKCYRRSLRTKNLEEAKELAREMYFRLQGDIRAGNRIFTVTAKEFVDAFIKHKADEANAGLITHGRVQTIKTSLNKWFLKFVGEKTTLEKISRHRFEEYYVWRRQQAEDVRNATLINERALISSLFKYGISRGFLRHDQMPIFTRLSIKKSQVERRDEFDLKEWEKLYRSLRSWVGKAEDKQEQDERKFIRDFIILSANTGLRFGEMRKLKWRMVKIYKAKEIINKKEQERFHAEIAVPQDTKTGARTAVGRRGEIFERIKGYSKHIKKDDWIFVNNETGEQLHKKVYYKHWADLMNHCGLSDSNKKLSYYSLRHTYITFRLLAGVDVFMLSENCGNSVKVIQDHYAHIKSEHLKRELTKDMKIDEAGQILIG
jgi:integrase